MAPISFVVILPSVLHDSWQQRFSAAGVTLAVDQKLSAAHAHDLDVVFIGRIGTRFGEFPVDVCRGKEGKEDSLILQVYFGAHRQELQTLIGDIFPEAR